MSPPIPPGARPRSVTLPEGIDSREIRLVHVERDIEELQRVDGEANKRLESMDRTLISINTTLTDLVAARNTEEKRAKFWEKIKSGVLLLLCAIGLTQLGKLAAIVQSNHVSP